MATIKLRRGLQANIAALTLKEGEFGVALDTGNVYVGINGGKQHLNPPGGVADSANKLTTARAFAISGDGAAGPIDFDGTAAVTLALTLANSGVAAGTYSKITVDAKGRVTAGAQLELADIGSLGDVAGLDTGTAPGEVVIVQTDGKIDSSLIPSVALVDTFTAANQAAMLALSGAEQGDICIRTDESKTYILKTEPASTLANWVWLQTPDSAVISVNNKTGAVSLTMSDIPGTAATAATLATQRAFSITGGATAAAQNFNGGGDVTLNITALDAAYLTGDIDGGTF